MEMHKKMRRQLPLLQLHAPVKPEDAEVNTKTGYKIVDEIYDFGSPWFGISGGEPLVRQDIFDIIEYAKATGFEVSLITSGFAFDQNDSTNSCETKFTQQSALTVQENQTTRSEVEEATTKPFLR